MVRGNTKTLTTKQEVKKFCFTLNNYSEEEKENIIKSAVSGLKCKYILGFEIGECGTPHIQGFLLLDKKKSWDSVHNTLNNKRIHLECAKGSEKSNIDYCTKDNNFITNYPNLKPKKPLKLITNLYPWQVEIIDLLKTEPDGRTVHWYHEPIGGAGKSCFCKYMYVKHGVLVIQGGKLSDIINILWNYDCDNLEMLIIDVPRKNRNKISYSAVECILNGMITNTKYETGTKVFNPPHIVVFSNYLPEVDQDYISANRWRITEITSIKTPPKGEGVLDTLLSVSS
jgi:hypothetical protein